jgi:methylmalonyl-CoA/ethylmalonyl-CoA epimerase
MKLDHIGIATNELKQSLAIWSETLGLEVDSTEEVAEQGVRVVMLPLGDTQVELLEPLTPDSPVGRFLAKRGPGIHHLAIAVADIRSVLAHLTKKGVQLIDKEPRKGAGGCLVAFVHPSSTNGVLLELVQRPSLS